MHSETHFSGRTLRRLIPVAALLLGAATAGAETIVIRPSLSYSLKGSNKEAYFQQLPGLISNGVAYSYATNAPVAENNKATEARMEFQIPPAVLLGLQSLEFKARQSGLTAESTGIAYLWFYPAVGTETKKRLTLHRGSFTAKGVTADAYLTRNLLDGVPNSGFTTRIEKLGLALTARAGNLSGDINFDDVQIIATYQPPPPDNAAAVVKQLTEAGRPFEGQSAPAVVGFDADPDGDGTPNFMELWRGTNPAKADTPAPLEFAKFSANYQVPQYPWVGVQIAKEADDYLLVRAEASHDMHNWRDISASRKLVTINGKLNARYTDSVPLGQERATYFRFVAEGNKSKFSE